jgi:hypothetical protein
LSSFCVLIQCVSGLSILDCHFGFLLRLFGTSKNKRQTYDKCNLVVVDLPVLYLFNINRIFKYTRIYISSACFRILVVYITYCIVLTCHIQGLYVSI